MPPPGQGGPPPDAIMASRGASGGPLQTGGGPPSDAVMLGADHPDDPTTHGAPETNLGVLGTLKRLGHMPIDVYHAFTEPPVDADEAGIARGGGMAAVGVKRLLIDSQKEEFLKAAKYREKARAPGSTIQSLSASAGEVGHLIAGSIPMVGPWISSIGEQAGQGDVTGATTNAAVGLLLPKLVGKAASTLVGAGRFGVPGELEVGQKMPNTAGGMTAAEVNSAAEAHGVKMTAGEQTGSSALRFAEGVGETSLFTRNLQKMGKAAEDGVHGWAVELANDIDPKKTGATHADLGKDLQSKVSDVFEQRKANADAAYTKTRSNIAKTVDNVDLRNIEKWASQQKLDPNTGQPVTYQSPAVGSLLDRLSNIHDEVVGKAGNTGASALVDEFGRPIPAGGQANPLATFTAAKNLRTELMSNADYKSTLPKEAKGMYMKAAALVDDAIDRAAAAKSPSHLAEWREANSQWSRLHEEFGKGPLHQILTGENPEAVARQVTQPGSIGGQAELIRDLKRAGVDISGVRRMVLDNIKNNNFRLSGGKMGGYSDSFINEVFGSDARELHQLGQTARNVGFNVNPSGSGKFMSHMDQIKGLVMGATNAIGGPPAADVALSQPGVIKYASQEKPSWAPAVGEGASKATKLARSKASSQQGEEQ